MKKKILINVILTLAIILLMGLITEVKAATDATSFVQELKEGAINPDDNDIVIDQNRENTVVLNNNIKLSNRFYITSGEIVLDLNGYTIEIEGFERTFNINGKDVKFKITDTSEKGTGTIKTDGSEIIFLESGNLIIEQGSYIADYCLINAHGGNLTINGGEFQTNEYTLRLHSLYSGEDIKFTENLITEINGGIFKSLNNNVVMMSGGNLTINGGDFYAEVEAPTEYRHDNSATIEIDNFQNISKENQVNINGGSFYAKTIKALSNNMTEEKSIIPITIKGGTFKSEYSNAIGTSEFSKITIEGGEFLGKDYAIGLYGNVLIKGGEFTSTGIDSIAALYERGDVTISGGIFSGSIAGVHVNTYDLDLKLLGGTFLATGNSNNALGGIILLQGYKWYEFGEEGNNVDESLTPDKLLVKGYKFDKSKISQKYIEEQRDEENPFKEGEYFHRYYSTTELAVKVVKESEYTEDILEDLQTNVIMEGLFNKYPNLIVEPTQKGDNGYDLIMEKMGENEDVISGYEISVEGGEYKDKLTLTFSVDEKYEGKNIKIYHRLANGEIETKEAVVKNGKVSIEVNELLTFILTAEVTSGEGEKDNLEDSTGDENNNDNNNNNSNIGDSSNTESENDEENTIVDENINTDKKEESNNLQTGDNIMLYFATLIISVIVIITIILKKKCINAKK